MLLVFVLRQSRVLQSRLVWDLQRSVYPHLPSAGVIGLSTPKPLDTCHLPLSGLQSVSSLSNPREDHSILHQLIPTSFRDPDMCRPGKPPERQQPLQCEVGCALPCPAGWGWLQPQGGGGQQLAERIGQLGAGASLQCPRCEPGGRPLYPAVVPRALDFLAPVSVQSWTALPHRRLLTSGVSHHLWMRMGTKPVKGIREW